MCQNTCMCLKLVMISFSLIYFPFEEWWSWPPHRCKVCLLSIIAIAFIIKRCKSPGLHTGYNSHYNHNCALLESLLGEGWVFFFVDLMTACMMSLVSSSSPSLLLLLLLLLLLAKSSVKKVEFKLWKWMWLLLKLFDCQQFEFFKKRFAKFLYMGSCR